MRALKAPASWGHAIGVAISLAVATVPAAAQHVPLAQLLPDLILREITLESPPVLPGEFPPGAVPVGFTHVAHFSPIEANELNNPVVGIVQGFNNQLATQFSTFPLGSSSGGMTYVFDESIGTLRRGSVSFGPLFAERALTIGRRKLSVGVTHQRTSYSTFEGRNLDDGSIKFYLRHDDCCTQTFGPNVLTNQPNGTKLNPSFEGDLIEAALSLRATTQTVAAIANYGVADRLDIGLVVPFVRVNLKAGVQARILRLATASQPEVHTFELGSPNTTRSVGRSGHATGLGDIVLRGKYHFLRLAGGGLAVAADLRLPTGDESEFLGAGGTQAKFMLIASAERGRFGQHVNVGYTIGDGNAGGTFAGLAAAPLPDEIHYSGGAEFVATPKFTVIGDIVGRMEGNRYFLFVPPLLWEAILNLPHYALIRDAQYRTTYDDARADWLEQQATEAFRRLWPDAKIGWSLAYGPSAQRTELDGLILRGNKAIIIECKWKSLTLVARRGDSNALRKDITQSILNAFEQGRRACDYIRARTTAEFTAIDGTVLKVESQAVNETVILSVLGRGALSLIAANPLEARALGLFKDAELPWALSLFDLLAVCRTMEFGGQFFDYARRRAAVIADGRFRLHDEWDLLEFYFAGALDTKDPQFANLNMVTFTGSGRELERLVLDPSAIVPDSLRRRIHPKVRILLKYLDGLRDGEATDASAFLLGLSDRQLQQMGELWFQTEKKTKADGKFHTISALPAPGGGGLTILCGRGTEDEFQRLQVLCLVNKYKHHAPLWLGIGAVPGGEATPFVVTLDAGQWVPDPELDRLFPVWPLPGTAAENP